jgi:hypothetical protein
VLSLSVTGSGSGRCKEGPKAWRLVSFRRKTCVHFSRSLCMNVAGEVWRVAGTGLRQAMCWRNWVIRCAGSTGYAIRLSNSPRILRCSSYMSSVIDAYRSSLNAVRILRIIRGNASVHCWSLWHMMAAFSVRLKRSTSPLAARW